MKLTDTYGVDLFKIKINGDKVHVFVRDKHTVLRESIWSKDQFLAISGLINEAAHDCIPDATQ
jgi:hypothetical protein